MSVEDQKVLELEQRKEKIYFGGGTKAIEKQKAMGKMTARERIIALLDEGSFHEYDMFVEHDGRDFGMQDKSLPGDGVIIGTGMICGQPIAIFAQDFTVAGGSLGFMHARKITKIMDYALNMRIPLIGINDSGGARIQEGVNALAGYGEIFFRNTLSSGVIPQISVILGPCAGGAVYSPALTDFVFVVENISKMFITGPEVIKTVLGEEISMEELGGARVHSEMTGNAHFFAQSEDECFVQIRKLISMIPMNNTTKAEKIAPAAPLPQYDITSIVPSDPTVPYDVRDVIKALVDESEFLEVMELFAANIVVGFGRIAGETVGFIANQPLVMAGVLDCDSSDKAARFIRFCDCFNIPIVTLEDLPGYLPGVDQEHAGVIRHGAKMLYAYSEATVPSITVVLRKAYGGGYIAIRLAFGRDCRDGARRRCQHHLQEGHRRSRESGRDAQAEDSGVQGEVRQPVCCGGQGLHRFGDRSRRDAHVHRARAEGIGSQESLAAEQKARQSSVLIRRRLWKKSITIRWKPCTGRSRPRLRKSIWSASRGNPRTRSTSNPRFRVRSSKCASRRGRRSRPAICWSSSRR